MQLNLPISYKQNIENVRGIILRYEYKTIDYIAKNYPIYTDTVVILSWFFIRIFLKISLSVKPLFSSIKI